MTIEERVTALETRWHEERDSDLRMECVRSATKILGAVGVGKPAAVLDLASKIYAFAKAEGGEMPVDAMLE